jgi:hypothetical protein
LKPRDHVGRSLHENTPVPEIDASDDPVGDANSRGAVCVVDLQRDRRDALDSGEEALDASVRWGWGCVRRHGCEAPCS